MVKDTIIHVDKQKGGIQFSTVSLYSLSLQLNDCGEGIMLETYKIIDKCLSVLQKDMNYFFKLPVVTLTGNFTCRTLLPTQSATCCPKSKLII